MKNKQYILQPLLWEKDINKISQNIVIWIYEDAYLSTFFSILWYEN